MVTSTMMVMIMMTTMMVVRIMNDDDSGGSHNAYRHTCRFSTSCNLEVTHLLRAYPLYLLQFIPARVPLLRPNSAITLAKRVI